MSHIDVKIEELYPGGRGAGRARLRARVVDADEPLHVGAVPPRPGLYIGERLKK